MQIDMDTSMFLILLCFDIHNLCFARLIFISSKRFAPFTSILTLFSNYSVYIETSTNLTNRHPAWGKLQIMKKYLSPPYHYDWVIWTDW
jgi:hypothetical protein